MISPDQSHDPFLAARPFAFLHAFILDGIEVGDLQALLDGDNATILSVQCGGGSHFVALWQPKKPADVFGKILKPNQELGGVNF